MTQARIIVRDRGPARAATGALIAVFGLNMVVVDDAPELHTGRLFVTLPTIAGIELLLHATYLGIGDAMNCPSFSLGMHFHFFSGIICGM